MIFLFSDVLYRTGGIETYLHALATTLQDERTPFRVSVAELEPCPLVDDLAARGIDVYRQRRVPGDRWHVRRRVLIWWLSRQLRPGDWVFCVRRPADVVYPWLVRAVHGRGARLAVSWEVPPACLPPAETAARKAALDRAVVATDAVVSTHRATLDEFREVHGYTGPVWIAPYHNLPIFAEPLPLPPGPPWKIGYMGRLDIQQKNLDALLRAVDALRAGGEAVELHLHGGGGDEAKLRALAGELGRADDGTIQFHGRYDHRRELRGIVGGCHFFVYASHFEGLPLTLLELLQAGRYCVSTRVGGIPDLYEGHPEAGSMAERTDPATLAEALRHALRLAQTGALDPARIRARYDGHFDLAAAHRAWRAALDLDRAAGKTLA